MKVKIIDSFSFENSHLQYNTSLMTMCSLIYPNIEYYCNNDVFKNIEKLLLRGNIKLENITHKYIYVFKGYSRIKLLFRYIISSIINICILLSSNKEDIIIYNFNNLFALNMINLINKGLHRRILICCHGELELFINKQEKIGLLAKILRLLLKTFFRKSRKIEKNIYFSVLGDVIKNNLKSYINDNHLQKFISVDHSYIFESKKELLLKRNEIVIGSVGAFDKSKGGDSFIKLASSINNDKIKFRIVGQIFSNINELKENKIQVVGKNPYMPLEQSDFINEIDQLDYIIFLYPTNSYKLKASGAIMDAINQKKKIIALRNEYFEYIFKKYGSIGYLFNNIDEIRDFILKNISNNENINFSKIQRELSPLFLYRDLKKKLSEIGFC